MRYLVLLTIAIACASIMSVAERVGKYIDSMNPVRLSMRLRLLLAALCLATMALFAGPAQAEFQPTFLGSVASAFASRDVGVVCRNADEDPTLDWAWGYVWQPTGAQHEMYLDDVLCVAALAIDLDVPGFSDRYKALGALVLTHEAYHLKRVANNSNEAITECRAMRHADIALIKLGAEDATIRRLLPLIMIEHYRLSAGAPAYNRPSCKIPDRYDKWLGR